MEKILLHHCCAPCSPKTVEVLSKDYKVSSLWYNPNIYPAQEYESRKDSLVKYAKGLGLELFTGPDELFETERNCELCYAKRIHFTCSYAKKMGINNFSTTLLASPFQKHDVIKEIALRAAEEQQLKFVYKDLRPEYFKGKNDMRSAGYYIQKYCGCRLSMIKK